MSFPGGASGKESTCQCKRCKRHRFNPWVRKIPWRRKWQPTSVFLPGKFHGQRGLMGYSPSVQFTSVSQSCPTLCNPLNRSTPGLPVHRQFPKLPKLMSIESVMPSDHLILCHPLLLPPSIIPSIRVFSNESALCIRWPKYWSYSFKFSSSNEYQDWSPRSGWISLQSKGLSRAFFNTTVQKHQFFGTQLSL